MTQRTRLLRAAVAISLISITLLALVLLSGAATPDCLAETPPDVWALRLSGRGAPLAVYLHPDGYYAISSPALPDSNLRRDWQPFPHIRPTDNTLCAVSPAPGRIDLYINGEWAWGGAAPLPILRADAAFDSAPPFAWIPVEMNAR